MELKTLTLTEPYATLVACGAKRIETRSWQTGHRAPIAIHASGKFTGADRDAIVAGSILRELHRRRIDPSTGLPYAPLLEVPELRDYAHLWSAPLNALFTATRGRVLAVAVLTGCERFTQDGVRHLAAIDRRQLDFGDMTVGRYGWFLRDATRLATPCPATGTLGVWTWTAEDCLLPLLPDPSPRHE